MTEDRFEDFLKRAAQSYNAPPARTPREEMWSAIQARRTAGPRVVYGAGSWLRGTRQRSFGARIWWVATAAVVLVATGVGIGRWTAAPDSAANVTTAVAPRNTEPGAPQTNDSAPGGTTGAVERRVATGIPPLPPVKESQTERSSTPGAAAAMPGNAPALAYQLAAVNHLSEAEALLTSFRTRSTADQQMDAQLGSWARELLSNTRLLLDSPVADHLQRRPLLQDLELLLVQIVQLSPGSTPQDRELIEKTLQQDQIMSRLRTAIPAGQQRGS